jgi:hypothetical protein
MSGPKSFSVKIFDEELANIFQLQCEVEERLSALESAMGNMESQPHAQTTAEGQPSLAEFKKRTTEAIKPFNFGTVKIIAAQNRERYERFIAIRKGILKKLIRQIDEKEVSTHQQESHHKDYQSYETKIKALCEGLEELKEQVRGYLGELQGKRPDMDMDEHLKQLDKPFEIQKQAFSPSFNKASATKKAIAKEKRLRKGVLKIKEQVEKILQETKASPTPPQVTTPEITKEQRHLEELTDLIRERISSVNAIATREMFSKEHNQILITQKDGQSLFLHRQLLRKVNQHLQVHALKQELVILYAKVLANVPHAVFKKEHQTICQDATQMLKETMVHTSELQHLIDRGKGYLSDNATRIRQDKIRQRERAYIKRQLMQALEDKKYEVMDDMQVIDFEKQSEFLIKVPEKDNYIQVELKDNDTISYVFYSNKSDGEVAKMSTEEKVRKVEEMDKACDDFYRIMQELDDLGISNKVRKPRTAKESYLKALPEKYKDKIKEQPPTPPQKKKDDKKRYL